MTPWNQTLKEILSYLTFGFSVFEPYYQTIETKEFGTVHTIKSLGFRKQSSIQEWQLNEDGTVDYVRQTIEQGDYLKDVNIPGDQLMIFSNDKEGDNYEGVSVLRSAYGSYIRKDLYLKLDMIGIEKMSIGTPVFYVSKSIVNDDIERSRIENIGKTYSSHQNAYIILPDEMREGGFEIQKGEYKNDSVSKSINREDKAIIDTILASFLEIGASRMGGNAQNEGQMDLFLNSICFIGDYIADTLDPLLHAMYVLNFGDPEVKLSLECKGINKKDFKTQSEIISEYSKSGIITPDFNLEGFLRKEMNLPELEEDQIKSDSNQVTEVENSDSKLSLEDKKKTIYSNDITLQEFSRDLTPHENAATLRSVRKDFDKSEEEYRSIIRSNLKKMKSKYLSDLRTALKQSNRDKAISSIKIGFNKQLRDELAEFFKNKVKMGSNEARKELGLKEVKMNEDAIVPNTSSRANILAKKNSDDIVSQFENQSILFSLNETEDSELSDKEIVEDTDENIDSFIESAAPYLGAGALVNKFINLGRNNTFFRNPNLVQGWQYSAVIDSRTTDLCLSLDGKTAPKNDPVWNSFAPPLHWNCRSIIIPILLSSPPEEFTGVDVDPIVRNGKTISKDEILKQKQFTSQKNN